jgi:hypothetical protein
LNLAKPIILLIQEEETSMSKFRFFIIPLFLLTLCFTAPAQSREIEHCFGYGIGLPYGGVGGNYEAGISDYFAPLIAIGFLPDNIGWNLGARLYYPGRDAKFRGRLTALYGTNTLVEKAYWWDTEYETANGFSGGLGFNWRFAKHWAFDADLFAVDQDVPSGYTEEGPDLKISLGFSSRW